MKRTFFFLLFIISLQSHAQTVTLKGTIHDNESKESIAGASITVKGKLVGTSTKSKGNFTINTSMKLPLVLVISSIGYQKQEIEVTEANHFIVRMRMEELHSIIYSAIRYTSIR